MKNKQKYVYYIVVTIDSKSTSDAKKAIKSCVTKIKKINHLSRQELIYEKGATKTIQYLHNFIVVTKKTIEHGKVWKEMGSLKGVHNVEIKLVDNNDHQK